MVKREGKSKSAKIVSFNPWCWENGIPPYKKERKREENNKKGGSHEIKLWQLQKKLGSWTIHAKWIKGWLMRTREKNERRIKEVLWTSYIISIKVSEPKWPYICTQPHYKRKRPFWCWMSWKESWLENTGKYMVWFMHCIHLCECES